MPEVKCNFVRVESWGNCSRSRSTRTPRLPLGPQLSGGNWVHFCWIQYDMPKIMASCPWDIHQAVSTSPRHSTAINNKSCLCDINKVSLSGLDFCRSRFSSHLARVDPKLKRERERERPCLFSCWWTAGCYGECLLPSCLSMQGLRFSAQVTGLLLSLLQCLCSVLHAEVHLLNLTLSEIGGQ